MLADFAKSFSSNHLALNPITLKGIPILLIAENQGIEKHKVNSYPEAAKLA